MNPPNGYNIVTFCSLIKKGREIPHFSNILSAVAFLIDGMLTVTEGHEPVCGVGKIYSGGLTMMRPRNVRPKRNEDDLSIADFYLSEIAGVAITGLVFYLTMILVTYNNLDTSPFNYASDVEFVRNWGGYFGADLSSALYHLFGVAAYFLVGALGVVAYMFLLGYRHCRSWFTLMLLPISVVAAAGIAALYNIDFLHLTPGGVIGTFVGEMFTRYIGFYGAAILLWATLWVSTVMVLRVSIVRCVIIFTQYVAKSRVTFFF
jgi:hypothetical protein